MRRTIEESRKELERVIARAVAAGLRAQAVISVAFGCPYEGEVPPQRVFAIARRLVEAGAVEIGFGDTTGMANPAQVTRFFEQARETLGGQVELTAHFHNTRGQGLANVLAALGRLSLRSSRASASSAAALCRPGPPATSPPRISSRCSRRWPSRPGYLSLGRLLDAARAVREVLGRALGSHTLVAGPIDWHRV